MVSAVTSYVLEAPGGAGAEQRDSGDENRNDGDLGSGLHDSSSRHTNLAR